jgi:phosphoglycolate phosphatase
MNAMNTAVVFDLDGTLLDTLADIGNSANQVLEELALPVHPLSAYQRFVGDGVQTLVERIVPAASRTPDLVAQAVARFAEVYDTRWNQATTLYAGIATLLTELSERRVPMAVLSNKPQKFTELCVEHFLASWKFTVVFGQRTGVPRKPDPAGALEIAARLNLAPGDCYYVGDTSVDMQTATGAGMRALGVAWGFRPISELKEHGATTILNHPCDLLDVMSLRTK